MSQIRDGVMIGDLATGAAGAGDNSAALPPGTRRPSPPQG
jgi:hypothetical protein